MYVWYEFHDIRPSQFSETVNRNSSAQTHRQTDTQTDRHTNQLTYDGKFDFPS